MKSLPTSLTTKEVNDLISGFPADPRISVSRFADIVTVSIAVKDRTIKLLSAATANGRDWHVMAKDGLISASTK
jgi:hypothetical protein